MALVFTVRDGIATYGVENVTAFQGRTAAQHVAGNLFHDNFQTFMDYTSDQLKSDFKAYAALTIANGWIILGPGVHHCIQAFIQLVRDEIRMGCDPAATAFQVLQTLTLLQRYNTHKSFISLSSNLETTAKPQAFTKTMKWMDWVPTFLNYLRVIPGRNGVPLKYVCCTDDAPDVTPRADFLDEYVNNAPLEGNAYAIDNQQVYIF